jgi:vacuolar-type H+-ATPase catalytic subunit A/Vma1
MCSIYIFATIKYHYRGVYIVCLDSAKQWQFTPANFREGQIISGGDIFGNVSNYF